MLTTALVLIGNRIFLRWWFFSARREHPSNFLRVLVIGSGNRTEKLLRSMQTNAEWWVEIVGILDPVETGRPETIQDIKVFGGIGRISELLATEVVDEVIVCVPRSLINEVELVMQACEEEGISVRFLANFYDIPKGGAYNLIK